ncbi:hypothetical protein BSKO_12192 [Bryopsis sp. KO-2023]|nr:hypothetical protein BSKO_12192 [Bryopsis sp. KO-2023]
MGRALSRGPSLYQATMRTRKKGIGCIEGKEQCMIADGSFEECSPASEDRECVSQCSGTDSEKFGIDKFGITDVVE